ncbi:MAG TPA: Ig-like domain repeat protein, partial [Gemmataceae bacterium]|nr:Ig-like domain repeat protein [Gemmataceae bacterium]
MLESLEDRTLLSLQTGTVLVANSPSVQGQGTFDGLSTKGAGIIAIDPTIPILNDSSSGQAEANQPNQSAFSTRQGLMCTPVAIAKDGNGNFFVADRTAFGLGAGGVIKVNAVTGAETVIAANQSYMSGPAAIVYVSNGNFLYVLCAGTAGYYNNTPFHNVSPDLIKVDLNDTNAGDVAAGVNQTQQYQQFTNPTALTSLTIGGVTHLYVTDTNQSSGSPELLDFLLNSSGNVAGQPTPLTSGALLTHPVGIAADIDNNLIVLNQDGTLVRFSLSTGMQSTYSGTPLPGNPQPLAMGLTVNPSNGTIYMDALASSSSPSVSNASIWSFPYPASPNGTTSGTPMALVPSNLLSLVTGMLVANDGQSLYVATSPARSLTPDQAKALSQNPSAYPTGVVQLTIIGTRLGDTVNRTMTRAAGLYCVPQDVAEDSQGNLYVADESTLELGAIIKIDPSGQTSLFAWGGDLDGPVGVTVVGNSLFAICTGDSSSVVSRLVQFNLGGQETGVFDLGLIVLSGIAPYFDGTSFRTDEVLVLDQGGNVQNAGTGQVWLANIANHTLTTFGNSFGAGETNRAQADAMGADPKTGICYVGTEGNGGGRGAVVKVPPAGQNGDDTRITITVNYISDPNNPTSNTGNSNNLEATDGVAVGSEPNGLTRIFVDMLGSGSITPKVTAVDPSYTMDMAGKAQTRIAESGLLSLVTGLADYFDYNPDANGNPQLIVMPPADQTVSEGISTTIALGSFSASMQSSGPWQVTVDWGDGSQSSIASVMNPGDLGSMTHAYSEERSDPYTVKVAVTNSLNVTRFASFGVTVSDLAVNATNVNVSGVQQDVPFNQMMATFTDPGGAEAPSDYSASINWGDNTPATAGTITLVGTTFTVSGSHTYETVGSFQPTVTITHESAPPALSAMIMDTVTVSAAPTTVQNFVDFETGDLSDVASQMNATNVSSPALDGGHSLQLLRNNSTAYAEIRQNGTSYYSVMNAGYNFLFQYASQVGEGGIVNFQDTASNYMAAIHLSSDGHLLFYDQNGQNPPTRGPTQLLPNQTYLISAKILLNPSPNSNFNWEVDLNGLPEMKGMGSFTQYGQPNGSIKLGGDNPYWTNYVYDDVCVQDLGQDPATSTSVMASPTTSVAGQPVTLTATIAPSRPGSPTGIVRFFDNYNTFIGTVGVSTSNGVTTATLTTRILGAGTHTIAAIYGGDGTFTPSFGELTQSVS